MIISTAAIAGQTVISPVPQPRDRRMDVREPRSSHVALRGMLRRLEGAAFTAAAAHLPGYIAQTLPRAADLIKCARAQRVDMLTTFFNLVHGPAIDMLMDNKLQGHTTPSISAEADTSAIAVLKLGQQLQRVAEAEPQLTPVCSYYAALLFAMTLRHNLPAAFATAALAQQQHWWRNPEPTPTRPVPQNWNAFFTSLPKAANA